MKITRLDPQTQQPTADSWTLSRARRGLAIGRAAPADIVLDSPDISPRHAELAWQSGALLVRDLASINGVYLRDSRILRAYLQDRDVFRVGGIPFLVTVEPADLAARRTHLLTVAGLALGAVCLAVLILAFIRNARPGTPETPPQEPTPILPPVADAAFQQMSDQYARAADLLDDSRRLIADGSDDLLAAQRLQQALQLNPGLAQADLLLQGLQENHAAAIERQIDALIAAGRFPDALAELDRQQALVGDAEVVRQTHDKIAQRIQYQQGLAALDSGDLDAAEPLLTALSPDLVPERQAALDRLAMCREAADWAARLERKADQNDVAAVQRLADEESKYLAYLSADALGEVHGALARAQAVGDIQKLVAAGNTYVLMQYIPDIPNMAKMIAPLRERLAPQAADFRKAAAAAAAATSPAAVPGDLQDARASYQAATAFAALYIIEPDPEDLRNYRLHAGRWNAYLGATADLAQAYIGRGAREEARAVLRPLLPLLDDYDATAFALRGLLARIAPVAFTPETARFLEDGAATAAASK